MAKQLKAGIIGMGFIGPAHLEGIRRLGFEVVAIAGSDQKKSDAAADKWLVSKAYGDWRALISDPDVDVVHIATPNYLHFEQAKAALEARKHVVCEKPLAMSLEESSNLVKLAAELKLVNAVNFNLRFYPLVHEAKARIQSGGLGTNLYLIQGSYLQDWLLQPTDWNWRLEPHLGGKLRAIADIGSHWIDLVTFITETRIKSVFADFETFIPIRQKPRTRNDTFSGKIEETLDYEEIKIDTEDYSSVLIKFDNGARGVMTVSQVSSGRKNRLFIEINGSESSIIWDSEIPNQMNIGHRDKPNQLLIKDPALMNKPVRWTASYPGGHAEGFPDTFKQLYTAVYAYILAGNFDEKPNFPTFLDGHYTLMVNEAIMKSVKDKCWVEVDSHSL